MLSQRHLLKRSYHVFRRSDLSAPISVQANLIMISPIPVRNCAASFDPSPRSERQVSIKWTHMPRSIMVGTGTQPSRFSCSYTVVGLILDLFLGSADSHISFLAYLAPGPCLIVKYGYHANHAEILTYGKRPRVIEDVEDNFQAWWKASRQNVDNRHCVEPEAFLGFQWWVLQVPFTIWIECSVGFETGAVNRQLTQIWKTLETAPKCCHIIREGVFFGPVLEPDTAEVHSGCDDGRDIMFKVLYRKTKCIASGGPNQSVAGLVQDLATYASQHGDISVMSVRG